MEAVEPSTPGSTSSQAPPLRSCGLRPMRHGAAEADVITEIDASGRRNAVADVPGLLASTSACDPSSGASPWRGWWGQLPGVHLAVGHGARPGPQPPARRWPTATSAATCSCTDLGPISCPVVRRRQRRVRVVLFRPAGLPAGPLGSVTVGEVLWVVPACCTRCVGRGAADIVMLAQRRRLLRRRWISLPIGVLMPGARRHLDADLGLLVAVLRTRVRRTTLPELDKPESGAARMIGAALAGPG
jgi:hypothetical protein